MQILPAIRLANGFAYQQRQNSYLVVGDGAMVLIDSGNLEERDEVDPQRPALRVDLVAANLSVWGFRPEQATLLLVTYAHFDHSSTPPPGSAWARRWC